MLRASREHLSRAVPTRRHTKDIPGGPDQGGAEPIPLVSEPPTEPGKDRADVLPIEIHERAGISNVNEVSFDPIRHIHQWRIGPHLFPRRRIRNLGRQNGYARGAVVDGSLAAPRSPHACPEQLALSIGVCAHDRPSAVTSSIASDPLQQRELAEPVFRVPHLAQRWAPCEGTRVEAWGLRKRSAGFGIPSLNLARFAPPADDSVMTQTSFTHWKCLQIAGSSPRDGYVTTRFGVRSAGTASGEAPRGRICLGSRHGA